MNKGGEVIGKFSQLSIKLILNLTEQLSMHSFDLEKWKVVRSLA